MKEKKKRRKRIGRKVWEREQQKIFENEKIKTKTITDKLL
jgi:hypothetical protein